MNPVWSFARETSFGFSPLCSNSTRFKTFRVEVIHHGMDKISWHIQSMLLSNLLVHRTIAKEFTGAMEFARYSIMHIINRYISVYVFDIEMSKASIKGCYTPGILQEITFQKV
jgi:hypothetical protein